MCALNWNCMFLTWLILFATGPFGIYQDLLWANALAFWAIVVLMSSIMLSFLLGFASVALPNCPYWARRVLGGLIFAGGIIPFSSWVYQAFCNDSSLISPRMPMLYIFAFCVAMLVFAVIGVIQVAKPEESQRADQVQSEHKSEVAPEIRLLERVAKADRGMLIRVSVDDHFVQVYTDKGMSRLRMRLRDALNEVPEGMGLSVHRSHWVMRDSVVRAEKIGAKTTLFLKDGTSVPVSRTAMAKVKAEGWL
ncbi:LytTR family DNA-binding domain-containing protein [Halocynthiibacter namhaensis]|uniref:LytTR family DNA-binding domain-containing protein n=1 Tax=Halocynthiibacter namhaensis TaxID=1290553 RepID=UPI00138E2FBF|nr:LytTR family DNA-binding domain-containing protein [Halocynthiibacter namhaensis]